jgi:hypothetical protein
MPTAICTGCNAIIDWRNTRGSVVPRICQFCGRAVIAAKWDVGAGGWVPRSAPSRTKGAKRVRCEVCGAARIHPSGNTRMLSHDEMFETYTDTGPKLVSAGNVVCWFHRE